MEYTEIECVNLVKHIKEHLVKGDTGLKLHKLRDKPLEVGCAICGKTVSEITAELSNG